MENASKALLIAAAVLIVIIIIAVGMKIYSSTTGAQSAGINTGKTISDKTGNATELATYEITGKKAIDYKGKTKSTIQPGDDIIIGETEKFKVFSVANGEIKAIPYYNLKLDSYPIKQATAETAELAGVTNFSSGYEYWDQGEDIDMSDSTNLVQPHIDKYRETLHSMGANEVKVEIARRKGFPTNEGGLRNPSGKGEYWMGTGASGEAWAVYFVMKTGTIDRSNINKGVRPIIIIPK